MPTQNILVILHCRALTLGLQSPEPTRFASFSRNLPWPNGKFVASHSEYAYFGPSKHAFDSEVSVCSRPEYQTGYDCEL